LIQQKSDAPANHGPDLLQIKGLFGSPCINRRAEAAMSNTFENTVTVVESGNGPYAQFVTAGRHVLGADEPEALGGRDTGPSPYEYILAGLGACTAMTLRMYATRQRWPLRRTAVSLRHEKIPAPDGKGKIDQFERDIHLEGDLTSEQRQRLLEIAEKCPVSQTLRRASVVVSRLSETASVAQTPPPSQVCKRPITGGQCATEEVRDVQAED
jgi:putative redox protein